MKHLIKEGAPQYKANLHCHTNLSDGRLSPAEVKAAYKGAGYSIVAITDHERLVSHHDLTDDAILFITAYEAYVRTLPYDFVTDAQSHINLYSKTPENKLLYFTPNLTRYTPREEWDTLPYHYRVEEREHTVEFMQKMIRDARDCGYLVCHNHPTWSFEDESMADAYAECFAMEIHNFSAYTEGHNEYNAHYYEKQLRLGRRMALIAADDNHNHRPFGDPKCDSFGGFTYILADKLDYASVITAMEEQRFYASCGPRIFSLTVEDGTLAVSTSAAAEIFFITNTRHRAVFRAAAGESITEGQFTLGPKDEWVYVEVIDAAGKRAHSRAYFRDELT